MEKEKELKQWIYSIYTYNYQIEIRGLLIAETKTEAEFQVEQIKGRISSAILGTTDGLTIAAHIDLSSSITPFHDDSNNQLKREYFMGMHR